MFPVAGRVGLFIAACAAGGGLLLGQQRPVFRADVNFVTVDAYPLIDGRVVEGLSQADFEVREDGRLQVIESFEFVEASERIAASERRDPGNQDEMLTALADPRARVFVAYLDVHHVGISGAYYGRQPIIELFQRILAPRDLIALQTSRNEPTDLTFGRLTTVVEEQLTRHWTWRDPDVTVNDAEELAIQACYPEQAAALIARRRQDQLLSNLSRTIAYLGEVREGRKTLFVFSQGWQLYEPDRDLLRPLERADYVPPKGAPIGATPPIRPPASNEPRRNLRAADTLWEGNRAACEQELLRLANLNSPPRFRELLRDASLNNVVVYPVNTAGVGAVDGPNDRLLELASNTGGTAIYNRNDLVQGVIDVSREFARYYLLGYASDNRKRDGTLRRIEVKVSRPGVEMKARRGYRAMSAEEAAAREAASREPAPVSDARATLDAALAGLARVRGTEDVFVRGSHSATGLDVVVELAPARIGAAWTVDVSLTPSGGGERRAMRAQVTAGARSVVVPVDAAGPQVQSWKIAATLRSADGEVLDGLGDIAASPGALASPRLSRSGSAAAAPLSPAADLRFMRNERLILDWPSPVALAGTQLRVLNREGAALPMPAQVVPAAAGALRGIVPLAALAAGDYVVEVTGSANGTPVRQLIAFRVVR